jgi:hypothetical protein
MSALLYFREVLMVWGGFMSATDGNKSDAESGSAFIVHVGEPRLSRSVTAGMSDVEFEAWLVAQGAVPMSEERRRGLNLGGSGAL